MLRAIKTLIIFLAVYASSVLAADIRTLEVDESQGRYTVKYDAVLDAPYDQIYDAIANPAHWTQLSRVVTSAEVLAELPNGQRKVGVTFHDCILIFCQTIHKNETLHASRDGSIDTLANPEESDFAYDHEHWQISILDERTRIQYEVEMTPNFFVPPLIGAYILKSKIRSLLLHITRNLEMSKAQ